MDLTNLIPQFGNLAWALVFFILALSVIVTVHELGHYLVGRWTGIGAEVFSVGFGPVLFSRTDRRGTRWQIAAFPFGGYVKFLGDADAASGRDDAMLEHMDPEMRRHTVHGAPLWARAATVAAGPVFNFILSILVFAGVMAWQGVSTSPVTIAAVHEIPNEAGAPETDGLRPGDTILKIEGHDVSTDSGFGDVVGTLPDTPMLSYTILRDGQEMTVEAPHLFPPRVQTVMANSAAEDAGLMPGDVILAANDQPLATFQQLQEVTKASEGNPMVLRIWRNGSVQDFTLVPRSTDIPAGGGSFETRYLIGLTAGALFETETQFPGVGTSLQYGVTQTWDVIVTTISGIWHMASGMISTCNIQGPIGIAETSGDAAAAGIATFIMFIAFLSTAVGLMNLFPVPVLDGGHLVFHAWEAATGHAPGDRAMRVLMTAGLLMIGALMVFALTNDLRCP